MHGTQADREDDVAYLNTFAPGVGEIDMTATAEFDSLLESADDLGIARAWRPSATSPATR